MAAETETGSMTPRSATPSTGASASTVVADVPHGVAAVGAGDARVRVGGLIEWLLRRRALRTARAQLPARGSRFAQLRQRARVAAELADRHFDPIDPPRNGDATPLVLDLYRQSLYWSLCALLEVAPEGRSPAALGAVALQAHTSWLAPDPRTRATLTTLLADDFCFERSAGLGADQLRALAKDARTLAQRLLSALAASENRVDRLVMQRATRIVIACCLLAAGAFGAARWRTWNELRPNLAAGKPWRTSSSFAQCEPEIGVCGGKPTVVFFQTREESNPWIEYDLGVPTRFSRVHVKNRTDSAPDRAVPLVVETSSDRTHWKALAQRRETFATWTAKFSRVTARYVRLRVARRSQLHLEQVRVLP